MLIFSFLAVAKGKAMEGHNTEGRRANWMTQLQGKTLHTYIYCNPPPPTNSHRWPLGIVATDSFLITWRISPSKGKNTFLPCGFMPTCLSSNLLFPDSLHHVGCVWLIGRLVTRCNNNDIELTSLKPLNHWRTTVVEIWCLTQSHLDWPPGMKNLTLQRSLTTDSLHTHLTETQSESGLVSLAIEVQRMAWKAFPPHLTRFGNTFC